jgi:hypothetical protein
MSDMTPCYIGINKAGECRAACVDDPEFSADTAQTVAEWIKRGMIVERVTVGEARERLSAKEVDK